MKCLKRFLFLLVLCSCFLFYKDTYALDKMELSSSNGSVLYSGNLGDNFTKVSNVKYLIFYFSISTATQSKYTLDWQFSYTTLYKSVGLELSWFLLNGNAQTFTNSWTTLNQSSMGANSFYLEYINHINFTSNSQGTQQVQLTYTFPEVVTITQVSYENKTLNFTGSTSAETNATINAGVNNIINNNNTNTNNIINNNNRNTNKIIEKQQENTNAIKDLTEQEKKNNEEQKKTNDNLTNEDSPDTESFFNDLKIDDSNSPVSDLMIMPLTLLNSYVNGFSSSCSPYNLGSLYGHDLVLPCVDIQKYIGSNLWSLIDVIFTLYMVYNIGMLCISIYESITELDDGMQELYTPQHSGHTRVSRNEGLY